MCIKKKMENTIKYSMKKEKKKERKNREKIKLEKEWQTNLEMKSLHITKR